jgi:hypothetical protein
VSADAIDPQRSRQTRSSGTDERGPADPGPTSPVTQLDDYRAAIGRLYAELIDTASASTTAEQIEIVVRAGLDQPEVAVVVGAAPGGLDAVIASLHDEIGRYRPGSPSSAQDVSALVRIYLLSQIDSFWWREVEPFHDADLARSNELRDLQHLADTGQLAFRFKRQPHGLPGRVRNGVVHRYLPRYEPHTSGLSQAMARPELIGLLNRLARDFAAEAPAGTPPLWVTSLLRTVEQQHRLRDLGYSALFPSAHCVGFAADVEMRWYARFGADGALAAALLDYQARGLVNVVDEGQAWHVCLSPVGRAELRS